MSTSANAIFPLPNCANVWVISDLGATLAEWQRRREEEESARRAAMQSSGGNEDEMADDVRARRRAKVIAKNTAKRAQEQAWEQARQAENQKKDEAIEAAWNQSRRAHSLETMSAVVASQTAQREQERLNDVSAARWAGLASVAQEKEESEKKNTGGKVLAMPVREDDPPTWWEKYVVQPWNKYIVQPAKNIWDKFTSLFTKDSTTPTSTPAALPTQTQFPTVVFTPTISISPTVTPIPTQSKISKIDGPMTVDKIPQEFRCTLPEKKYINGQELYSDYYYRCKIGEKLLEGILIDINGWWWQDGQTIRWDTGQATKWKGIENNLDVWNLALALGLDAEGTNLRKTDNRFGELIEQAIFNKFWHFNNGVYSTYNNVPDPEATMPLGTNGRLVALGSLESLQKRVTGEDGFLTLNISASQVIRPPYHGVSTNAWEDAWNYFVNNSQPPWKEPLATAPYEIGNIDLSHPYYSKVEEGLGLNQVLYRSPLPESVRAIVLTYEQFSKVYSHLPK